MNWEWLNWIGEDLNPDALRAVRGGLTSMSIWTQTLLFGMLVLLAGCCLVECLSAFRMNAAARFITGFTAGFFVCFLILHERSEANEISLVLYSLIAGTAAGLLYAFAVRIYRLVTGAAFGIALAPWLLGSVFSIDPGSLSGRVWSLVIIAAAAAIFAILTKKFDVILSAVTGGTLLSLILETFVTYDQIPYISDNIDIPEQMYWNLAAVFFIAIGIIVQGLQYLSVRKKEKKEQAIAETQAMGHGGRTDEGSTGSTQTAGDGPDSEQGDAETPGGQEETSDTGTGNENGPGSGDAEAGIEEAEAVLVEKARELAAAAVKSGEKARRLDRYADVADGLYSPAVAAGRLGISEEKFIDGMRAAGYGLPDTEGCEKGNTGADEVKSSGTEMADDKEPQEDNIAEAPEPHDEPSGSETDAGTYKKLTEEEKTDGEQ